MTLGIVRQAGFPRQNGRNQAFNHAGNMVGAALSGYLGWRFGFAMVFWLAVAFAVLSIISVFLIPRESIDDDAARGMKEDGDTTEKASGFRVLLQNRPLLILAAALACFHLGNGALLPMYGLAVVSAHPGNPTIFVAETITGRRSGQHMLDRRATRSSLTLLTQHRSPPQQNASKAHTVASTSSWASWASWRHRPRPWRRSRQRRTNATPVARPIVRRCCGRLRGR